MNNDICTQLKSILTILEGVDIEKLKTIPNLEISTYLIQIAKGELKKTIGMDVC